LGIGIGGMFLNKALLATWTTIDGSGRGDGSEDIAIPEPNESVMGFDMDLGVYYRAERVYMGLSTTHLLESGLKYETAKSKLKRHYYAIAGCLLPLTSPAWEISPSVMAYSDGTASQFTANVNFMYNKKFWGGVGYRLNDAVIAMVGFDVFEGIKLGYAFDYSYTSLNNYFKAGGSHEVVLSYCFNLVKDRVIKKYKSVRFL
jgi:type IX secretion system PorP/SprF family membrane protein